MFSIGTYQAFFNGFVSRIVSREDRVEGGAQVAVINPDGSGFREVTSGANNGFRRWRRTAGDSSIDRSDPTARACGS
jgi:hypothetical protein